jgi:predicted AlkP superfamily pyrophosphatase or phosphodiesterase
MTTFITGVWPSEHGVWQVRIKDRLSSSSLLDRLPDAISTTLQGLYQFFKPTFDLSTVPYRRRRRFELHRFKYFKRERDESVMDAIGPYRSFLGHMNGRSRFHFAKSFTTLRKLLPRLPSSDCTLELLEVYALDLYKHWHLDRPEAIKRAYRMMDEILRQLYLRCEAAGTTLAVISDHGQDQVVGSIPLRKILARSGVPETDYTYFLEAVQARFWFHTDAARGKLVPLLQSILHTRLLRRDQMEKYHVPCSDDSYGQFHLVAKPGWIFFPHDFHHPMANFFMGLTEETQRTRLFGNKHKGNHGYLPENPSEKGFAILADDRFDAVADEADLIDMAPTFLSLLGEPRPVHMKGRVAFRLSPAEAAARVFPLRERVLDWSFGLVPPTPTPGEKHVQEHQDAV